MPPRVYELKWARAHDPQGSHLERLLRAHVIHGETRAIRRRLFLPLAIGAATFLRLASWSGSPLVRGLGFSVFGLCATAALILLVREWRWSRQRAAELRALDGHSMAKGDR